MDNLRILTGDELVAKGTTKIDCSLPEIGLKDVIPNGSWLEKKRVQSALEARKHLIEVERIEKCGVLSKADWREELMLAKVTHKVGGHWQYIGHNVGKKLFLKPEEALFLMEINCLCLKHGEVTVSLQQAYSLLLRSEASLLQYKVYAALGRVGYKVFRHETLAAPPNVKKINSPLCGNNLDKQESDGNEMIDVEKVNNNLKAGGEFEIIVDTRKESEMNEENATMDININDVKDNNNVYGAAGITNEQEEINTETCLNCNAEPMETAENVGVTETLETNYHDEEKISTQKPSENEGSNENDDSEVGEKSVMTINTEIEILTVDACSDTNVMSMDCSEQVGKSPPLHHQSKLQLLEDRKLMPSDSKALQTSFKNIPDLLQNVVTVKVPEEKFIPKNVFLNKTSYVLDIESIRETTKDARPTSSDSRAYSIPREVNGAHVRSVRDSSAANTPHNWTPPFCSVPRFQRPNFQFRPFWRPDYSNLNAFFNRPFIPPIGIGLLPRPNFFPRPLPPFLGPILNYMNFDSNVRTRNWSGNTRKRIIDTKRTHLEAIKRLAYRLTQLAQSANINSENVQALQRLINTYNVQYKTKIRLTDQNTIEDDNVVETIELDCEDESARKKKRTEPVRNKYEENLNKLKQLALKLKDLVGKDKASGRHRRALSNIIKRFNKSYNADVYLNSHYEVTDRLLVNLDSSSDSDCVIEESLNPSTSTIKKLKNPFNILKRLSEKHLNIPQPSTSKEGMTDEEIGTEDKSDTEFLVKTFRTWLPDEHAFGRAEVVSLKLMYNKLLDSKREDYLYEFLGAQPHSFRNWLDIKISFLRSFTVSDECANGNIEKENGLKSLIGPKDCTDMPSVLKKLSIIQTNTEVARESSFSVDFDVYNRDVQNFRKTNRPKPHFRVICIHESSSFPSGSDIFALHSKYDDNVSIMFAVVGIASVSYLQVNPAKLPVYMPKNDDLT